MEFQNHNPKIYLIAGKGRHGKDTVAHFISEYYEEKGYKVINLSNSYYLKDYVKRLTSWDGREETKPRELLQQLGTNLIREQIDEYFFIRRVIEDIKVFSYFYDIITISDVRMPYEIDLPRETFSKVKAIHVNRPNFENGLTVEQQQHRTEVALDSYHQYDYYIENDGTMMDLKEKIEVLLKEEEVNEH